MGRSRAWSVSRLLLMRRTVREPEQSRRCRVRVARRFGERTICRHGSDWWRLALLRGRGGAETWPIASVYAGVLDDGRLEHRHHRDRPLARLGGGGQRFPPAGAGHVGSVTLADQFLPIYDGSDEVATVVAADSAVVWEALLDADLLEVVGKRAPLAG